MDLYFILSQHYAFQDIVKKGKEIFAGEFNERLFREQLGYFKDMNYAEQVDYMPGFEVEDEVVKAALKEISLS